MLGGSWVKGWSVTQETVSLSSGESEAKGVTKGCTESLYVKHLLEQQDRPLEIIVHTDASAAQGMLGRLGVGRRAKHLEIQNLWVQQLIRRGVLTLRKMQH